MQRPLGLLMGVVRCGGGDPVAELEKRGAKIVRNDQAAGKPHKTDVRHPTSDIWQYGGSPLCWERTEHP